MIDSSTMSAAENDDDLEEDERSNLRSLSFRSRIISFSSSLLGSVSARTTTLVCIPEAHTTNFLRSMPVPGTKTLAPSAEGDIGVDEDADPAQLFHEKKDVTGVTEGEVTTSLDPETIPLAFKISTLTVILWSPLTTTAPRDTSK